jgi:hypothetical protein
MPELAQAVEELTSAILTSAELSADSKQEALELFSMISYQATAPRDERKPHVARVLLGRLAEVIKVAAPLMALWDRWYPVTEAAFR